MNIRNGLEMITPETYGFIYMTHNMVNGKKYIGQKRIDKYGEWKGYIGSGVIVRKAVKKYGYKQFYKDILDVADCEDDLNAKEIYWIKQYNAVKSDEFYNIDCGGYLQGAKTTNYDNETKDIAFEWRSNMVKQYYESIPQHHNSKITIDEAKDIVERMKNGEPTSVIRNVYPQVSYGVLASIRRHRTWKRLTKGITFPDRATMSKIKHNKAILQYDLYGNFIARYNSTVEACEILHIENAQNIYGAINTKYATAHGFFFVHENDDWVKDIANDPNYKTSNMSIIDYEEMVGHKPKRKCRRTVLQFNEKNELVGRYNTAQLASDITGIPYKSIAYACTGVSHKTGGYFWRYEEDIIDK